MKECYICARCGFISTLLSEFRRIAGHYVCVDCASGDNT